MRTQFFSKLLGTVFCASLAVVASFTLLDLSTGTATAEPAIVIKNDGLCGMPGSNAAGNIIFGGYGIATTKVENGNKVTLSCKGSDVFNLSGRGQHYSGFACGVRVHSGELVVTADSHATVSRSGKGSLTCTFTKP